METYIVLTTNKIEITWRFYLLIHCFYAVN